MNEREKLVAQVQATSLLLAGGAIATPEHVLAAALLELILKRGDDE